MEPTNQTHNLPSTSKLISSVPIGRGAEIRIELLAYDDRLDPHRVISLRVYVPGKGTDAGKMFPVKNGLTVQEFNLQRIIAGLIKVREMMAKEDETPSEVFTSTVIACPNKNTPTSTKVLSCGTPHETGFIALVPPVPIVEPPNTFEEQGARLKEQLAKDKEPLPL